MPCQAAIDLANLAIQADIARDVDKAISLYTRAADELEKAAKTFPDEAAEMRAKAKEVNDKYGITTKAKAAATTAYNKAAEIENKHGVTSKVGGAIAGGLASFTKAMGGSDSKAGAKALPSVPK